MVPTTLVVFADIPIVRGNSGAYDGSVNTGNAGQIGVYANPGNAISGLTPVGTGVGITQTANNITFANQLTCTSKSANFNAAPGYFYTITNSCTMTLPDATACPGQWLMNNITAGSKTLTYDTAVMGQTVAGQASGSFTTTTQYTPYIVISDGANWQVK